MENIQWLCDENNLCTVQNVDPLFTPFFSSGDIMISILLLLLIIIELINLLRGSLKGVDIHRKYQGNNSPDGKEFYKL